MRCSNPTPARLWYFISWSLKRTLPIRRCLTRRSFTCWTDSQGNLIQGDVWPLPADAFAHPRSAGTYARFVRQYVRESQKLSLLEALGKTSLIPAQVLEKSVPQMRGKGRLQVGADADIVVFDLNTITDRATYVEPAQTSVGVQHLIVNGEFAIQDGQLLLQSLPGRPVRRPVQV